MQSFFSDVDPAFVKSCCELLVLKLFFIAVFARKNDVVICFNSAISLVLLAFRIGQNLRDL